MANPSNEPNGQIHKPSQPLRIIVVGAGIAGLTVGIALRRNGHHVQIYEQSRFAQELGAAVHVAPNAHGLLKALGVDPKTGANKVEYIREYNASGELNREIGLEQMSKLWHHDWMSSHRVRLHEALKEKALMKDGLGQPCELHLSSSVADIDPENASITLADGTRQTADVIIGADGVHSKTRRKVPGGENARTFGSGKSAFRFMVLRKDILDDPATRPFSDKPGIFTLILGTDRRIIVYPTSNNTLLNFACIHPEIESQASDDWNTTTNKEALLRVYQDFAPGFQALLRKADPESLKVWRLLDMENFPTFVHGRLALIGDAAHPFLPHQGQGAAIAMEDAAALATVLEKGLTSAEIPERLELYNSIRYDRACKIQEFTRLAGMDTPDRTLDAVENRKYNFGHDEFHNSAQKLREWKWARMDRSTVTVPVAFAPILISPLLPQVRSFATASVRFRTSRTLLQNFLPPGLSGFSIQTPGTVMTCTFAQITLDGIDWLESGCRRMFTLYIHDVSCDTSSGERMRGSYVPIVFEDQADAVVNDRENYCLPAVYSPMAVEHNAESYRFSASSKRYPWAEFVLEDLRLLSLDKHSAPTISYLAGLPGEEGLFTCKSLPSFKAEAQSKGVSARNGEAFWVPFEEVLASRVTRAWTTDNASIRFGTAGFTRPTVLHEAAGRLSEIPIFQVISAQVVAGVGQLAFRQPQRL